MKQSKLILLLLIIAFSCRNRDLNEGEEFRPRVLQDNFEDSHFTKVTVDGVEYLMLERDNNNPHEGFGFMAFRGNVLLEKEDTVIAYLKAMSDMQVKYFAQMSKDSEEEVRAAFERLFAKHLKEEEQELVRLEMDSLDAKTE